MSDTSKPSHQTNDTNNTHNHEPHEPHESPIKTPKQLITVIILSFIVPITLLILLAGWVASGDKPGAGTDVFGEKATAYRIKPIASSEYKIPGSEPVKTGMQVYTEVCAGCHATGAAGAPKFGDVAAWSARISQGLNTLIASAIKGKGGMPARGGNPDLTDAEIQNAIAYMGNAVGAGFKEAAVPAVASMPTTTPMPIVPTNSANSPNSPTPIDASAISPSSPSTPLVNTGKKLYDATCATCHGTGMAGAPKFGDKAAWSPRAKAGIAALTASAIHGKNAMPPRGGSQATDAELQQAIEYMLQAAQ